jgi:acrylyl-CoA reductase (NADPH)/3-hydroxypropionyl-CoA dehydratase/3-hydroxypropionyl-CoA synthetase
MPTDVTLEAGGSYVLNLGTVVRALFTTLRIQPGRTMFVEGAATGTGLEALKSAAKNGLDVVGLVSSPDRAAFVRSQGARGVIDRRDPAFASVFTTVDDDVAAWERAGAPLVRACEAELGGRLADYVVSHAGETAFPRSFQLLARGGTLTFYGASSGYWFSFAGARSCARESRSCFTTGRTGSAGWKIPSASSASRRRAPPAPGSSSRPTPTRSESFFSLWASGSR